MGKDTAVYKEQKVEEIQHIEQYERPKSHTLRCSLTLLGIWFWFTFTVCIPSGQKLGSIGVDTLSSAAVNVATDLSTDDTAVQPADLLLMLCIGSGLVQATAAMFIFVLCRGIRRTKSWKRFGFFLLFLYILGALILIIARARNAAWVFSMDTLKGAADAMSDLKKTSAQTKAAGRLIAEAVLLVLGVLIVLPDFGCLMNWEEKHEVKDVKKTHKEKVVDKDATRANENARKDAEAADRKAKEDREREEKKQKDARKREEDDAKAARKAEQKKEDDRDKAERKKDDDRRKEERKKVEAERKAEDKKEKDERKKEADGKKAEDKAQQKKEEEARKAEDKKEKEARKKEEDAKKAEERAKPKKEEDAKKASAGIGKKKSVNVEDTEMTEKKDPPGLAGQKDQPSSFRMPPRAQTAHAGAQGKEGFGPRQGTNPTTLPKRTDTGPGSPGRSAKKAPSPKPDKKGSVVGMKKGKSDAEQPLLSSSMRQEEEGKDAAADAVGDDDF